jgi:hypothetical protein
MKSAIPEGPRAPDYGQRPGTEARDFLTWCWQSGLVAAAYKRLVLRQWSSLVLGPCREEACCQPVAAKNVLDRRE